MSEDDPTPTTARRQLGVHLRRLRRERDLTVDKLADYIGAATSQVSRIETGARTLSADLELKLIHFYQLPPAEAAVVSSLADAGRKRVTRSATRPAQETDYVKIEQTGFVELEKDSVRIREFNSGHIPGLLQTEAYMRASMAGTAPDVDAGAVANAIRVRKARQRKLEDGVTYEVIVDEAALARQVGSAEVMADQARAIYGAMSRNLLDFAVIPFDVGAHPGLNSQFVALSLSMDDVPDVVFSEGLFGHVQLDKLEDVDRFDRVWAKLSALVEAPELTVARLLDLAGSTKRAR